MPGLAPPRPREEGGPVIASAPAEPNIAPAPLQSQGHRQWQRIATLVLLVVAYITVSTGLITYNKFLITKDRFPFAIGLVLIHSGFGSVLTGILYLFKPSLFPSLASSGIASVDRNLVVRGALPVAVLFSGQLLLSNAPYLHASVAFLQMMKESNLVLVYIFSLIAALETFSCRNVCILLAILVATTMTIHGEMNFSLVGFTMQGMSQLCESSKIVLQAMLLSHAGRKLDALTYVLLVMPLCFLILCLLMCFLIFVHPIHYIATPQWSDVFAWWPHLLANACVAFTLNVIVALFVKHSSAIAFILAGISKDAILVLTMCLLMKEVISGVQAFGFVVQLSCVLLWSLMKAYPQQFEDGVGPGLGRVLFGLDYPKVSQGKKSDYGSVNA